MIFKNVFIKFSQSSSYSYNFILNFNVKKLILNNLQIVFSKCNLRENSATSLFFFNRIILIANNLIRFFIIMYKNK